MVSDTHGHPIDAHQATNIREQQQEQHRDDSLNLLGLNTEAVRPFLNATKNESQCS